MLLAKLEDSFPWHNSVTLFANNIFASLICEPFNLQYFLHSVSGISVYKSKNFSTSESEVFRQNCQNSYGESNPDCSHTALPCDFPIFLPSDVVIRGVVRPKDFSFVNFLINSIPDTELGNIWADAIRLISEYGLRPIEVLHLSVKKDRATGEDYFYCSYEKRSGGGTTEPRVLHPLPLIDDQGEK